MQIYSQCGTWTGKIIKMARDFIGVFVLLREKIAVSQSLSTLLPIAHAYYEELLHQNRDQSSQSVYHNYSNQIYAIKLTAMMMESGPVHTGRGMIADDIALETKIYALKCERHFYRMLAPCIYSALNMPLTTSGHVWHDSPSRLITCTDAARRKWMNLMRCGDFIFSPFAHCSVGFRIARLISKTIYLME